MSISSNLILVDGHTMIKMLLSFAILQKKTDNRILDRQFRKQETYELSEPLNLQNRSLKKSIF